MSPPKLFNYSLFWLNSRANHINILNLWCESMSYILQQERWAWSSLLLRWSPSTTAWYSWFAHYGSTYQPNDKRLGYIDIVYFFYANKVEIMWSRRRQEKNKEQIKIHWFISNVRNWQTKLDDLYINAELILNQQKSLMLTNIDIGLKRTKTYRSSIILFNKPQQLQWHIQYLNTFKISSSLTFKKKKTQICKQIY